MITPNADIAISNLREDNVDAKIFTDRSGANNKIGASAVLYRNGRLGNLLQFLLGSTSTPFMKEKRLEYS